jgi:hypothetical protein
MVGVHGVCMAVEAYTVELSTDGHKRKEVFYTQTAARARRQARSNYPEAIIYDIDTL